MRFLRDGDELVVHRLDRLGRSVRDVLNLVHELEGRGASLRVLEPEVSTAGDMGRLVVTVLCMVADMERQRGHRGGEGTGRLQGPAEILGRRRCPPPRGGGRPQGENRPRFGDFTHERLQGARRTVPGKRQVSTSHERLASSYAGSDAEDRPAVRCCLCRVSPPPSAAGLLTSVKVAGGIIRIFASMRLTGWSPMLDTPGLSPQPD